MRRLYTCVFFCLLPFAFFRLWRRGAAAPAYRRRWSERLGIIPKLELESGKSVLWFHTVSVGEFIAATPLIEHYTKQAHMHIVITCTTPTGSERIRATFGKKVSHYYLPYDIPHFVNKLIRAFTVKPSAFVCLETELWPNVIHCCKRAGIPVILANARLSEKSANGYKKLLWLTRPMLQSLGAAAIQNDEDKHRFIELGLDPARGHSIGNIKFDLTLDNTLRERAHSLKTYFTGYNHNTKILIAASTHRGEDEEVIEAFTQLKNAHPDLKLILVPRHPERFDDVYNLCCATAYTVKRRSIQVKSMGLENTEVEHTEVMPSDKTRDDFDIVIGDTMGELLLLYGAADIAFVGGSFVDNGGHNYIEAAAWSLPIFSGPSTFNFREVAKEMQEAGGLQIVASGSQLAEVTAPLLADEKARITMGEQAKSVAEHNRGALAKLIHIIDQIRY